jgi:hypothetical protein
MCKCANMQMCKCAMCKFENVQLDEVKNGRKTFNLI